MVGGNDLDNFKNILVMGARPVGLVSTLALLKRYSYDNLIAEKRYLNNI